MTEVFRVVGNGVTFGPYLTLGAARGVATNKQNYGYYRKPTEPFRVERSAVEWSEVPTDGPQLRG